MSQLSEQTKELYEERVQNQAETNKQISNLISEARKDPKKYLPYGPVLMHIYDQERIKLNHQALIRTIGDEKKIFCQKKCNGNDSCLNQCQKFVGWATNYGFHHFKSVHKYAYTPTANTEEE